MEVVRIDYSIANFRISSGQSFYENCDPDRAIGMFQRMCLERNYPFTITAWYWFSRWPKSDVLYPARDHSDAPQTLLDGKNRPAKP